MTSPQFQFRLERVRSIRERAEETAKEELAAGLAHRMRGAALLQQATEVARSARNSLGGSAINGLSGADLMAAQVWADRADRNRQAAALELDRRDTEVDARRTVLARAAQDHEVIARLKDKQRAEHDALHAAREQSNLDEIALTVFRRKAAA